MQKEESIQKPQTSITLPELPAGAKLLLPVLGIPVALHALTGAAIGVLTFAIGASFVGLTKDIMPKTPKPSPRKSPFDDETAA